MRQDAPREKRGAMNEAPMFHAPPVVDAAGVVFSGHRSDFRRLITRGAGLELVTLTLYRFWLATDMRRHLWSHTSVDGNSLEYTGTPKELLIGFLFALAILVPIYLVYFFIGIEAERLQAFASVPLFIFFFLFFQFAIYRARRYRLTRTVWRGVRFWMTGSGWSYAWRAALWTLLVIVTVGLALPWQLAALERYKMRHSHYGDLPGRFVATGGDLFKRGWWLWLAAILALVVPAALIAVAPAGALVFTVPALVGLPCIYAAYKAIGWQWWVSGIRFGEVSFESKLSMGDLLDLYWKVIGWSALLGTALSAWVGVVSALVWLASGGLRLPAEELPAIFQGLPVLAGTVLGYLVAALIFGLLMRLYLVRDVWERVASTTIVHNLAAAENVAARGEAAGPLGEGLADGLDVGGF
jgi:uncharacterized membrane protein YjgN (DUF898 family)